MFVYGVRHCKVPGGDGAPRNGTQRLQDRRTNRRQPGNSSQLETCPASAADGRTHRTCRHVVSPGRLLVLLSTRGVSRGRHDPCAEGHVVVHRERPSVCGRFERDPRSDGYDVFRPFSTRPSVLERRVGHSLHQPSCDPERFLSTDLGGSTFARLSWPTGSLSSLMLIPDRWFADSSTQTVAGSSIASKRSSRVAASPSTPTCATSSATSPLTSDGFSWTTANSSGFT